MRPHPMLAHSLTVDLGREVSDAEVKIVSDRMRRQRKRPKPISLGRRPDNRSPIERRLDAIEGDIRELGRWVADLECGAIR